MEKITSPSTLVTLWARVASRKALRTKENVSTHGPLTWNTCIGLVLQHFFDSATFEHFIFSNSNDNEFGEVGPIKASALNMENSAFPFFGPKIIYSIRCHGWRGRGIICTPPAIRMGVGVEIKCGNYARSAIETLGDIKRCRSWNNYSRGRQVHSYIFNCSVRIRSAIRMNRNDDADNNEDDASKGKRIKNRELWRDHSESRKPNVSSAIDLLSSFCEYFQYQQSPCTRNSEFMERRR